LGTYLKQQLLGTSNVNSIYTLEPMTHLQTVSNLPDMAAIGFIQQFALLNQKTILGTTGQSYPINAEYGGQGTCPQELSRRPPTYLLPRGWFSLMGATTILPW